MEYKTETFYGTPSIFTLLEIKELGWSPHKTEHFPTYRKVTFKRSRDYDRK